MWITFHNKNIYILKFLLQDNTVFKIFLLHISNLYIYYIHLYTHFHFYLPEIFRFQIQMGKKQMTFFILQWICYILQYSQLLLITGTVTSWKIIQMPTLVSFSNIITFLGYLRLGFFRTFFPEYFTFWNNKNSCRLKMILCMCCYVESLGLTAALKLFSVND